MNLSQSHTQINIGIVGTISCGKSTFLNAIAGRQYSDTEIMRTTMIPQIYLETDVMDGSQVNAYIIRQANRTMNQMVMRAIDDNKFDVTICQPIYHDVDRMCDIFDPEIITSDIKINIYDTPGLNDSDNKMIYFEWMRNNIQKFDIVVFITDISRGLDSHDEMEILRLILTSMCENRCQLICLMNKCDDMYYDDKLQDLVFEEQEQENIYLQANNILADMTKKFSIDPSRVTPFLPISAENCFIYRILKSNPEYQLDAQHINRLCKNECGANQWKKMSPQEKETLFGNIVHDLATTSHYGKIKDTGYFAVKTLIQNVVLRNVENFFKGHLEADLKLVAKPLENVSEYIFIIKNYQQHLAQLAKFALVPDWSSFWYKVIASVRAYANNVTQTPVKIIDTASRQQVVSFAQFETIHNRLQDICLDFTALMEYLRLVPEYPASDIEFFYQAICETLIQLYRQLIQSSNRHLQHFNNKNIMIYLQTILKFCPRNFAIFSDHFLKIALQRQDVTHIMTSATELVELIELIFSESEMQHQTLYLTHIVKFLIAKQAVMMTNQNAFQYCAYLTMLRRRIVLRDRFTPLDVLLMVVEKRISLLTGTSSVRNIYRQELNHETVTDILDAFASGSETKDFDFENGLFDVLKIWYI